LVKVSGKQSFQLVNELCLATNPFDEWFRFHCMCVLVIVECKGTKKIILMQDFGEKIWKYQKKFLSLVAIRGTL
jgi:hypothetical protein